MLAIYMFIEIHDMIITRLHQKRDAVRNADCIIVLIMQKKS